MKQTFFCLLLVLFAFPALAQRPDVIIADFEGKDYGAWSATGEAFGPGPAQGTLPDQMPVTGYLGHGLVNSYYHGDGTTGTLTSPAFMVSRKYINFLIGGGKTPGITCVNLLLNGKVVRAATGPNEKPGGTERLDWATWDVTDLEGKTVRLEIVDRATGGWGHISIDQITLSDRKMMEEIQNAELYNETYRPQFHFSSQTNWLNDPNGLVYYKGEYHLFFQHNPSGIDWGNMTWGHAVSSDLLHWHQIANALEPDALGTMFSGSAVVDKDNTSGFQTGKEPPLVAIYTAAGGTSDASKGQPFTQCIAYSNDRGRTWTKYAHNPVLAHIEGGNRDPKVVWHAPSKHWIMTLYLDKEDYAFFSSPDLKTWTHLHNITVPGCSECPDFFPISVYGKPQEHRWVWTAANGHYLVGTFDGKRFTPEGGPQTADYGPNYYAVQTYSNIRALDGRRIQIAWMNGGSYPHMPFNQQMSFPCEMTLRETPEGMRIYRWPIREIKKLYGKEQTWRDVTLKPGDNPLAGLAGDLWDIEAEFELKDAQEFGLQIRGETIRYHVNDGTVASLNKTAPLKPQGNKIRLRVLVDRSSLEVFGNQGQVSLTGCFLPRQSDKSLSVYATGGSVRLVSLRAIPLHSVWPKNAAASK